MSELADRYRRFLKEGGVADLSDRVKLRLTGADRVRFLNGQVTANVQKLAPATACPACVTTAKGRLCADVWLHATADALFVDADASVRESLPPRFERYIISDAVTLEDVSDELRLIHVIDPLVEQSGVRANRFGRPGIDLWLTLDEVATKWGELKEKYCVLDEPLLESLRIEVGIPRWGRELDENTLPPEAGLERTHIDYDKGCYIGQEVISRLKSVGHVNRALIGFVAREPEALHARMRIFAAGENAVEIGALTSAAWSFALEKPVALGYLKRGSPMGELLARAVGESGPGRIVNAQDLPLIS